MMSKVIVAPEDNNKQYLIKEFEKRKYLNSAGGHTHPKHDLALARMKESQKKAKKNRPQIQ